MLVRSIRAYPYAYLLEVGDESLRDESDARR